MKHQLKTQCLIAFIAILLILNGAVYAFGVAGGDEVQTDDDFASQMESVFTFAMQAQSTMLYGVDVSTWQSVIDWNSLKSDVDFVIMRSSYGAYSKDSQISRNQSEARRLGVLRGYYHYAYPQYNTPEAEADNFLSSVGTLQPGEVLCLDYEESTQNPSIGPVDWSKRFLDRVYAKTGVKGYFYTYLYMQRSFDWSPLVNSGYPLWLAYWDDAANFSSPTNLRWPCMTMKQYGYRTAAGIGGNVDGDVFNGGSAEFKSYGLKPALPVVKINVPTTASTYSTYSGAVTVGGTVTSSVAITNVSWSTNRGKSGTCTGTKLWTASSIPLLQGSNIITITAMDEYGQKSQAIITITYILPSIRGKLTLQDFVGSVSSIPVTVLLRKQGGNTTYISVGLSSDGSFTLANVASGTYDIAFKANHWLRKTVKSLVVNGNVSGLTVSLVNGDVNGDNTIGTADYNNMRKAWGSSRASTNWNSNADLNGDGNVNMGDYVILKNNWGLSGDL